jgi:short subunit dehydrogenase-like uncharacterized protein
MSLGASECFEQEPIVACTEFSQTEVFETRSSRLTRDSILIYGATGFTGRLVIQQALARGLHPTIAGRDRARVMAAASSAGLEPRWASLDDSRRLGEMLDGIKVVLNVAGPFRTSAPPLVLACLERSVHYLDLTGEYASIEWIAAQTAQAEARGIMLMPGVGFDIVATDCAAVCAARSLSAPSTLSIGLTGLNAISRGSAQSVLEQYGDLVMVRRNGQRTRVAPGELVEEFDFGAGSRRATAITWADIASAGYSTGIPDVTVYYEETPMIRLGLLAGRYGGALFNAPLVSAWQNMMIGLLATGPSPSQRAHSRAVVVARAMNSEGQCAEVRLETPEVYSFTASTAMAIADRVLAGDHRPGFQTPSSAFGVEFGLALPGVTFARVK